jgi:hypothetical protein
MSTYLKAAYPSLLASRERGGSGPEIAISSLLSHVLGLRMSQGNESLQFSHQMSVNAGADVLKIEISVAGSRTSEMKFCTRTD